VGADPNPRNLFAFGDEDGCGFEARLQHPIGVHFSTLNKQLYIADTYNHKIKKIDLGQVIIDNTFRVESWLGSSAGEPGVKDGKDSLRFNEPNGLWLYDKDAKWEALIVADSSNNCIRFVRQDGSVETPELEGVPAVVAGGSDCGDKGCRVDFE